jgi:soluble lytic murein transglycosylase-like protein
LGAIFIVVGLILTILVIMPQKASGLSATIKEPVSSLDSLINENAARYGVPGALIKAVIRHESNFDPDAVNPSDPSYGLMQVMPILAEDFGLVKDWRNVTEAEIAMIKIPSKNVQIGSWFLGKLFKKYPLDTAIQMYNVGEAGFNSGHRNAAYLAKVKGYYNAYQSD